MFKIYWLIRCILFVSVLNNFGFWVGFFLINVSLFIFRRNLELGKVFDILIR